MWHIGGSEGRKNGAGESRNTYPHTLSTNIKYIFSGPKIYFATAAAAAAGIAHIKCSDRITTNLIAFTGNWSGDNADQVQINNKTFASGSLFSPSFAVPPTLRYFFYLIKDYPFQNVSESYYGDIYGKVWAFNNAVGCCVSRAVERETDVCVPFKVENDGTAETIPSLIYQFFFSPAHFLFIQIKP